MADSDGEYVDHASSDEYEDHHMTTERGEAREQNPHNAHNHGRHNAGGNGTGVSRRHNAGSRGTGGSSSQQQQNRRRRDRKGNQAAWETVKRSWDTVGEAEDGKVVGVEFLEAAEKRRRVLRDTTPLQRGIIRHMVLVLDMSFAMASRDYLPTCHRVALNCAAEFVRAFFEQNPISQLAILAMRDGVAVRVSDMGGNPAEHLEHLHAFDDVEPQGNPSLQNALEMCRGALFHTPSHGTREVLVVFGALLSSDPADIHDTIAALVADRIRVSIVGLAAQVAICSEICARTNGGSDSNAYAVALHDVHFRELILAATTPPATRQESTADNNEASLLMMGFPSRAIADAGVAGGGGLSVCACHNKPIREGYACTRCGTKVCRLPAECPACGLTLILSTHLARSYHHLFPLRNWVEVSWVSAAAAVARAKASGQPGTASGCHACLVPFPEVPPPDKIREIQASTSAAAASASATVATAAAAASGSGPGGQRPPVTAADVPTSAGHELKGVSESGRYACQVCGHHFCIDCDVFAHEVIHNCPGCQSDTRPQQPPGEAAVVGVEAGNGAETAAAKIPKTHKVKFTKAPHKEKAAAANGNSTANGEMIID